MDSSSSFPFLTAIQQGRSQWNSALSTSISNPSATNTSAIMQFYGGTRAQINNLGIFNYISSGDSSTLGATKYTSTAESAVHQYGSRQITQFTIYGVRCYVRSDVNMTQNNYLHTTTHEMGHAMGWDGYSTNSSNVMWQGRSSVTALQSGEKNHLAQIYR